MCLPFYFAWGIFQTSSGVAMSIGVLCRKDSPQNRGEHRQIKPTCTQTNAHPLCVWSCVAPTSVNPTPHPPISCETYCTNMLGVIEYITCLHPIEYLSWRHTQVSSLRHMSLVGQKVAKNFSGKVFEGIISSYLPAQKWYLGTFGNCFGQKT